METRPNTQASHPQLGAWWFVLAAVEFCYGLLLFFVATEPLVLLVAAIRVVYAGVAIYIGRALRSGSDPAPIRLASVLTLPLFPEGTLFGITTLLKLRKSRTKDSALAVMSWWWLGLSLSYFESAAIMIVLVPDLDVLSIVCAVVLIAAVIQAYIALALRGNHVSLLTKISLAFQLLVFPVGTGLSVATWIRAREGHDGKEEIRPTLPETE